MKATGIVRRIDDLGRIVIPKEIRHTLRIREGDPLELYTTNDGEIIFKKYSPFGAMAGLAKQAAQTVNSITNHPVIVVDRDGEIIGSAGVRGTYIDRETRDVLEKAYHGSFLERRVGINNELYASIAFEQIKESGSYVGALIILKKPDELVANLPDCIAAAQLMGLFLTNELTD